MSPTSFQTAPSRAIYHIIKNTTLFFCNSPVRGCCLYVFIVTPFSNMSTLIPVSYFFLTLFLVKPPSDCSTKFAFSTLYSLCDFSFFMPLFLQPAVTCMFHPDKAASFLKKTAACLIFLIQYNMCWNTMLMRGNRLTMH